MNDEISFGDYRESQPQVGLPPDRNPHFSIGWVGAVPPAGMPVFVDLDTMRQLELHSQSNVAVELGGVLLGERRLDAAGNPYVVVQDALAAEHYEATRGSFKFTHETWQAISRQREAYPPHLEMVGWYHTHPDWSVFLSSMDLFICDHFFNHPLDLALVIDPIRDDRGWFVWKGGEPDGKSIERTPGFYLFAHRARSQELLSVVESYNEVLSMPTDPRFRTVTAAGGSSAPIVHLHERPLAVGFWALGLLAAAQLLLLTWLAVRSTLPPLETTRLEAQLTAWGQQRSAELRAESYRELLVALAERQPDEQGLVARWTAAVEANRQLQTALQGHSALQEKLQSEQTILNAKLTAAEQVGRDLERRLSETASEVDRLRQAQASSTVAGETVSAGPWTPWLYWGVGAGVVLAAAAGGFLLGRRGWWEGWATRERDE